jgi:ankyrin repeat protein
LRPWFQADEIFSAATREVASLKIAAADSDLNRPDSCGLLPLVRSASAGDCDELSRLLSARADPAACDAQGVTPLVHAILGGHADAVEVLARASCGAGPAAYRLPPGHCSGTALHLACERGDAVSVVAIAQAGGIQLMFRGAPGGGTPLHAACAHGHADAAEALLAAADACGGGAAERLLAARAADGSTWLHAAARAGSAKLVVRVLASRRSCAATVLSALAARTVDGATPLEAAAAAGHDDVCAELERAATAAATASLASATA